MFKCLIAGTLLSIFSSIALATGDDPIGLSSAQAAHLSLMAETIKPALKRQVVINIPSYTLIAYEYGQPVMEMPVVVGKTSRPTPIIETHITGLKYYPEWTAPPTVMKKDILPTLGHENSFIQRFNIRMFVDGREVTETELNPELIRAGKVTFRQDPGADSALGLLRFDMDNTQSIFLHDTWAKYRFSKEKRAMTSGCILVSDWKKLGAWSLGVNPGSFQKRLRNKETRTEKIEPIPVSIIYSTTWVDSDGKWSSFPDVYARIQGNT